jgi:hypothetical protein
MTEELLTPPTGPFFRFPDAVAGMTALDDAGLLDDDLNPITASHTHALDVIGAIDGYSGWHVNYLGELPNNWMGYLVTPAEPIRVFAT